MKMKLEGKIDEIVEDILEGRTFRYMAAKYGCALGTLHSYVNRDEHSARVRNALEISASSYADKAEEVLQQAENDRGELMRARELAQHYRWKAGKRNPKKYGDRVQSEVINKNIDLSNLSEEEYKKKLEIAKRVIDAAG